MARGHDTLDLVVNGARLAEAVADDLSVLERPLRSLALADSPIHLRGRLEDCQHVIERLHQLGRRAELPLVRCEQLADVEPLVGADRRANGTWALFRVYEWAPEAQARLAAALEALDEGRLSGQLTHEDIPRVIVVDDAEEGSKDLLPELSARLSYFKLRLDRSEPA